MNTGATSHLVPRDDLSRFGTQIALGDFLAGYSNNTFLACQQDLRQFVPWCSDQGLELFRVKRTHIE
jgi:site-specific recombinase XerD